MSNLDSQLQTLRKTLDEQKEHINALEKEMDELGIVPIEVSLDNLSQSEREQYLAFECELNEITNMLQGENIATNKATFSVSSQFV